MGNNKKAHRKIGVFVGVSTVLVSVCGPVLESVVYAEEANVTSNKILSTLPKADSAINFSSEFSSTTNGETSTSESSVSSETTEESSKDSSKDSSSSTDKNTTSSSKNTGSSSSSITSPSSSSNGNISGSSSNNNGGNTSKDSKDDSSKDSSKDDSLGKVISKTEDKTPIKYSRNQSTQEFIEEIGEDARVIGQKNDLYASVMIAQAILESGSGNSGLSREPNYNLFGIKGSYEGKSVEMPTLEDNGKGSMYTISAKFRKYPSYKESLEDYATLMTGGTLGRSTFYQGAWKSNTKTYEEATKYLTGRYATDTRYNDKLNGLIETYNLAQYDSKKPVETKLKKSKETEAFIKEISTDTKEIAEKNDMYASVLIADAIIKSTSGNNILAENKNIYQTEGKYQDKSVEVDTIVKDKKETKLEKVTYKEYPSYKESIEDHVKVLKEDKAVYPEMTTKKKDNYKKVTAYMTAQTKEDRSYHKKLNSLIATYDLTKLDKKIEPKKEIKKDVKVDTKKKDESIDILNQLGRNMTTKLSESLEKPSKYDVTKK